MNFIKDNPLMRWLSKIDQYLLLNYRAVWETRAHYMAAYLAISYTVLCLGVMLTPLSLAYRTPNLGLLTVSLTVINSIVLFFWMYKASVYAIERNFGISSIGIERIKLLTYFGCIALLGLQSFIPKVLMNHRIDNLISEQELIEDIQVLNEGNIYFPASTVQKSDLVDNVFECRDRQLSYELEFFGKPEIESFNVMVLDPEPEPEENKMAEELIREAQANEQAALQKINDYKRVFAKYSYPLDEIKATDQEVFHTFTSNTHPEIKIWKTHVRDRISYFKYEKGSQSLENTAFTYGTLSVLMCSFIVAMLLQIGKHIGIKHFILAIVYNIGLLMGLSFVTGMLGLALGGSAIKGILRLMPVGTSILLLFHVSGIVALKKRSLFRKLSLVTLQVYSPFSLLGLVALIGYHLEFMEVVFLISLGVIVYLTVFLPTFRQLHLRLRALPSEK